MFISWSKNSTTSLGLEASRLPSASGAFEFASLGDDSGTRVATRNAGSRSEVAARLTGSPLAGQENGVLSFRSADRQLIESDAFAAGAQDGLASFVGEALRSDRQLRHLVVASIVGDGANDDANLTFASRPRHQLRLKTVMKHAP